MKVRSLREQDAPRMLEWMHDADVTGHMNADFASKTLADAERFILAAVDADDALHLAIASDEDEYMGTVSLKHIDPDAGTAEFAITVHRDAMGRGYSWFGMEAILRKAFDELGLTCVYWCVSRDNGRAVRFYDKHRFHETVDIPGKVLDRYAGRNDLKWYSVLKGDELDTAMSVAGCPVVRIRTVPTLDAGELSFFEGETELPFGIKRFYYISKVPEGVRRGFHAHRELKQLLFCPYGRIRLILADGNVREEIELRDPSVGVIIDRPIWREMLWLEKNSVLCVAASEHYDPDDYIRDYNEYLRFIGKQE